jgi:hypothetical protein
MERLGRFANLLFASPPALSFDWLPGKNAIEIRWKTPAFFPGHVPIQPSVQISLGTCLV